MRGHITIWEQDGWSYKRSRHGDDDAWGGCKSLGENEKHVRNRALFHIECIEATDKPSIVTIATEPWVCIGCKTPVPSAIVNLVYLTGWKNPCLT